MAAPSMFILGLLAAGICDMTGMRSLRITPRRLMAMVPARRLWHPLLAIAPKVTGVGDMLIISPNTL